MKIITTDSLPKDDEVVVGDVQIQYTQKCDEKKDWYQDLKIYTGDVGGGKYFVIETERWAFNTVKELVDTLIDFKKRAGIK